MTRTPFGYKMCNFSSATLARLQVLTAPVEQIRQAQKNGVRGEVIGLACSGNPVLCPVQALIQRVLYLWQNSAPLGTPTIAKVFNSTSTVTSSIITMTIPDSVLSLGLALGFLPSDVSA